MATLFVKHSAIDSNECLPKSIKNCTNKVNQFAKYTLKICPSGEIRQNMVTLTVAFDGNTFIVDI